ncbi:MAG: hypothetical protein DRP35_07325 [Candidatus Zixiibacteriota bacterium]|nr:MAG: hypothetical protein DRP35_07325 [candidate division Zixibacteria bacterium]
MYNFDVIFDRFKKINFQVIITILVIVSISTIAQSADIIIDKQTSILGENQVEISINIDNLTTGTEYSGFDFLVAYEPRYMGVSKIEAGEIINMENYEWEYFTYRLEFDSNCNSGDCPKALIHIFGQHSLDFQNPGNGQYINASGEVAKLNFIISYNREVECRFLPISFYWQTCQNNILIKTNSNVDISNHVFDYTGDDITFDQELPSWTGASEQCQISGVERTINFYNGGIDISCVDQICHQGDINLNSLLYEIGDYILFENYFVYGLGVFNINVEGQIAATDINCDGLPLSVSDLTYLHRIIIRDMPPY